VRSESWAALDEAVAALPTKDVPVYAYCTGGIRCVKVGAYLVQKHGLTNVRRLKHGIIGYERWANSEAAGGDHEGGPSSGAETTTEAGSLTTRSLLPGVAPIWEGENFIFDQRRLS
jgi:predicted sulfurtransferase